MRVELMTDVENVVEDEPLTGPTKRQVRDGVQNERLIARQRLMRMRNRGWRGGLLDRRLLRWLFGVGNADEQKQHAAL